MIEPSADVAPSARVADNARVWHLAQVREGASIGEQTIVGRGAYIGEGVRVGDRCKIQNYALVYEPASLADGVFVGPAAVFTNDHAPRAINPDGSLKSASDWDRPYALVVGVPARRVGWVGEAGVPLVAADPDAPAGHEAGAATWVCPATGRRYVERDDTLSPEEAQASSTNTAEAPAQTREDQP